MSQLHNRVVRVSRTRLGWAIDLACRGIGTTAVSLAGAIHRAERIANEYGARIEVAVEPVTGDRGPLHLIGNPVVYIAEEADGEWSCAVLGCPRAVDPNMRYVGPRAGHAARQYAERLVLQFAAMARDAQARKQRIAELKAGTAVKVRVQ